MTYLIFSPDINGHYLEYLHHLYMYAYKKACNDKYIFIISYKAEERLHLLNWPETTKLEIEYISAEDISSINYRGKILGSWKRCLILKKYVRLYNPDVIILPNLILYYPAIILFRFSSTIKGIIYRIPAHSIGNSLKLTLYKKLFPRMLAYPYDIKTIWLLNDHKSAELYNCMLNTCKFKQLPDPINITVSNSNLQKTTITQKIKLVHCGGMGTRKGTFTIINAIRNISPICLQNLDFLFIGNISNSTERQLFNEQISDYTKSGIAKCEIGFVPFETLIQAIYNSDWVLIPYQNIQQSSGILGYAAYYRKPVIGPAEGLLGQLIRQYNLGITIENLNSESLCNVLSNLTKEPPKRYDPSKYVQENSITNFSNIIFSEH